MGQHTTAGMRLLLNSLARCASDVGESDLATLYLSLLDRVGAGFAFEAAGEHRYIPERPIEVRLIRTFPERAAREVLIAYLAADGDTVRIGWEMMVEALQPAGATIALCFATTAHTGGGPSGIALANTILGTLGAALVEI